MKMVAYIAQRPVGRFFVYLSLWLALLAPIVGFMTPSSSAPSSSVPNSQEQITLSFAPIVATAAPAVVNVYAKRLVATRQASPFRDPFFNDFFNRNFRTRPRFQNSLGSGVIVRADGIVVTNHHVIEGGDELTIILSDQREYRAELLLADARTDLAVLKLITDEDIIFPTLAYHNDEDKIKVGDLVLAIGNPFGVGQTVTGGIISGLARSQVGVSDFQSFIQTDAPINPGNSGGALVSMRGQLVGINTAIYTRSGGSVGIGFAIPVRMVKRVVAAALGDGQIRRAWIGARLQNVNQALAENLGLARPMGALVVSLDEQSPLAKGGLRNGDVITTFNNVTINQPEDLRYQIAIHDIGMTLRLVYIRKGKKIETQMVMVAPPETPPRNTTLIKSKNRFNGIELANINPALSDELRRPNLTSGVIVTKVTGNNSLRLQVGDILQKINRQEIATVSDAITAINAHDNDKWSLVIKRGQRVTRRIIR